MSKVTVTKKEPGGIITCESGRKYIFLKQEGDKIMAISEGLMAENMVFDKDSTDYSKSLMRKLMDETLLPLLEEDFGAGNIVEHEADLTTVDMQKDYGTCRCKVRPMTFDEAREFNDLIVNKELPDWWWTCTPWSTKERGWGYSEAVVSPSGIISNDGYGGSNGVRPFCILKSNIFESEGH